MVKLGERTSKLGSNRIIRGLRGREEEEGEGAGGWDSDAGGEEERDEEEGGNGRFGGRGS